MKIMRMGYRLTLSLLGSGLLACTALRSPLEAAIIYVAAPGLGAEGNTFSFEPFGTGDAIFDPPSSRYQQVINATEFAVFLTGVSISQIGFRSDANSGAFGAGLPAVQVNFSVTARGADGLSLDFAENTGSHEVVVFPRGPLILGAGGGNDDNNTRIFFPVPYFYNPAEGNLLVDIRRFERVQDPSRRLGSLDAANDPADTVSRVFSHDVNALIGTADTIGLTTIFGVTPIPEPSTVILLMMGLSYCCWRWLRTSVWGRRRHELD